MTRTSTISSRTTRILTWNANGLLYRKAELLNFLVTENIDIALISETHLNSRLNAEIRNYRLYTCHHPSGASHGGAAVYVKTNLQHHEFSSYSTPAIQAAVITVRHHCGKNVSFAAVYSPPRHVITATDYKVLFNHLGNKWIARGDFNAKHHLWGSRIITSKGKELFNCINMTNTKCQSNGFPTYWPTDPVKKADCIDFFLLHGISSRYIDVSNIDDLSSDHSPIVLTLSDNVIWKGPRQHLTSKRTD